MHYLLKGALLWIGIAILISTTQSQTFKHINIIIEQDSIDDLESHPFTNEDVHGDFAIDGKTYVNVELHYRGAYYLLNLINRGSLRNWKVKFAKSAKLEGRREWNFNYENYIRQNLAYHTFRQAGVPVVSSENVILSVNGQRQGLYLKYEDPDNKDWLEDIYGDDNGDLYKAAYDMPNQTKYFAALTYLGPNDADYFLHYRKQTNKKGASEFDYSSIREFTELINQTPNSAFEQTILRRFAVVEFIEYMVVANFMANWDSYPYRPKNYFLYDNPQDGKWHYIPWDLDGTFQVSGHFNPIGAFGSIFHYFDGRDPYNHTPTEPLDRPLIWNIMEVPRFRDKYCYEYKKAIDTYLSVDSLFAVIDSISLGVGMNTFGQELTDFNRDVVNTKDFITRRVLNVTSQLAQCVVEDDPLMVSIDSDLLPANPLTIYPNPATSVATIELPHLMKGNVSIQVVDLLGKEIKAFSLAGVSDRTFTLNTDEMLPGQYFVTVRNDVEVYSGRLVIGF